MALPLTKCWKYRNNGNDENIWISNPISKILWPHCAKVQSTRRRAIYLQKRFQFYLITNLGPFSVLLQYIYILASHISVNTQCGHRCIFEKFKKMLLYRTWNMILFNGNYFFDCIKGVSWKKRLKFHCAFEHKKQLELYVIHSC